MNESEKMRTERSHISPAPTSQTSELLDANPLDLEAIADLVHTTAQHCQGKSADLLAILRLLESLHQEIRDDLFQKSLPDNRQALYALLRDIETEGGWPYIHRMKLQSFLSNLVTEPGAELPHLE
ncbi:MAG TPA: hypothetical protein V6C84_10510 [Coleofasciculaceae cyanobacterium]|jgi:hypothetical protein